MVAILYLSGTALRILRCRPSTGIICHLHWHGLRSQRRCRGISIHCRRLCRHGRGDCRISGGSAHDTDVSFLSVEIPALLCIVATGICGFYGCARGKDIRPPGRRSSSTSNSASCWSRGRHAGRQSRSRLAEPVPCGPIYHVAWPASDFAFRLPCTSSSDGKIPATSREPEETEDPGEDFPRALVIGTLAMGPSSTHFLRMLRKLLFTMMPRQSAIPHFRSSMLSKARPPAF